MIRDYLKKNILITDGAMGTYYAQLTGQNSKSPEYANIHEPQIIEQIHTEYIQAGAKLIKTNTFSANSFVLGIPIAEVEKIIAAGIDIACKAARGKDVFVAASIGPLPETIDKTELDDRAALAEYRRIADIFLAKGIKIFIFETFSDLTYLREIAGYIKAKESTAFVVTQFAINPEGYTRKGIHSDSIIAEIKKCQDIDAFGYNCGIGPGHLYNFLKNKNFDDQIIAVSPNAGYPEIVHERTVYIQNPAYFAEKMREISGLGVKILGGCCGTTPEHIEKIVKNILPFSAPSVVPHENVESPQMAAGPKKADCFREKLDKNKFIIAVELDPPFNANVEKILHNARICKENGVDIITVADSPMGRARVDSIMLAAKIKREVGIETMPHVCCRDRNINALKSAVLAGYVEDIRNILAVTGDPIAEADKNDIKEVFNLNSLKLMELLSIMNKEFFADEPINIAGALNLNAAKPEIELARMSKKAAKGAELFLTQPIYDQNVIELIPDHRTKDNLKILGGIMPLVSYRNAQFLNNEMAGIRIPEHILAAFDPAMKKEEAEKLGIEIAVDTAQKMQDRVSGFYLITPFNRVDITVNIIRRLTF